MATGDMQAAAKDHFKRGPKNELCCSTYHITSPWFFRSPKCTLLRKIRMWNTYNCLYERFSCKPQKNRQKTYQKKALWVRYVGLLPKNNCQGIWLLLWHLLSALVCAKCTSKFFFPSLIHSTEPVVLDVKDTYLKLRERSNSSIVKQTLTKISLFCEWWVKRQGKKAELYTRGDGNQQHCQLIFRSGNLPSSLTKAHVWLAVAFVHTKELLWYTTMNKW